MTHASNPAEVQSTQHPEQTQQQQAAGPAFHLDPAQPPLGVECLVNPISQGVSDDNRVVPGTEKNQYCASHCDTGGLCLILLPPRLRLNGSCMCLRPGPNRHVLKQHTLPPAPLPR